MRTPSAKASEIKRKWYVIDVADKSLGRVATQIADVIRGKHRPDYTPHVDTGDFVVVINAEKVKLTGAKLTQKSWQRHSGFPGGLKTTPYNELIETDAPKIIELAVKGMMPNTPLTRDIRTKLKVYAGPTHPHAAQNPEPYKTAN